MDHDHAMNGLGTQIQGDSRWEKKNRHVRGLVCSSSPKQTDALECEVNGPFSQYLPIHISTLDRDTNFSHTSKSTRQRQPPLHDASHCPEIRRNTISEPHLHSSHP